MAVVRILRRVDLGSILVAIFGLGIGTAALPSTQVPASGVDFTTNSVCEEPRLAALSPPRAPTTPLPEPAYDPLRGNDPAVDLGIGHLRSRSDYGWNWSDRIQLPLFSEARGSLSHWIVDGWLVPVGGDPRPLGVTGLTETGYEVPSFVVLAADRDGWIRLRFDSGPTDEGWTHSCFFAQASGELEFERWETRFLSGEISPLYFRTAVPHILRLEPTRESRSLRRISSDENNYAILPLEVRGDWMRVELREPSDYCSDPDAVPVETTEGWIQWRDATRGPWLWYYTRGC